jgi:hypothetical protein
VLSADGSGTSFMSKPGIFCEGSILLLRFDDPPLGVEEGNGFWEAAATGAVGAGLMS